MGVRYRDMPALMLQRDRGEEMNKQSRLTIAWACALAVVMLASFRSKPGLRCSEPK